jgi:acyl-ACP thioesterase
MFYQYERHFDISDYGRDGRLRIDSILKIFQEAAISHSDSIGYTADTYMGSGNIWMHNKNLFRADFLPDLSKKLTVKTWSRGIDKFKGYRNYEILADGEKCMVGSSIWIYLNIEKRRPVRPTDEMTARYDSEDVPVMDDMIRTLQFAEPEHDSLMRTVSLRPSDFDVNGHVSNVMYGQFADVLLSEFGVDITGKYVGLSYMHEIRPDVTEVQARACRNDGGISIGVYADGLCACLVRCFDEHTVQL